MKNTTSVYCVSTLAVATVDGVSSALLFPSVGIFAAIVAIWAVLCWAYNSFTWHNRTGIFVLATAMCLVTLGFFANLHMFTIESGGTLSHPVLNNPDSKAAWNNAVYILGDESAAPDAEFFQKGYGTFVAVLLWIFGRSVAVPMLFNLACTMLTIIVVASISVKVLAPVVDHRSRGWIATCAMIMISSLCYFLQMADLVLKEAPSIFSSALAIRCILNIYYENKGHALSFSLFAVAALILSCVRNNYLLFIILGIIVLLPTEKIAQRQWRSITLYRFMALTAICFLFHEFIGEIIHYKPVVSIALGNESGVFSFTPNQEPWATIIRDYNSMPWFVKLLILPFSAAVQFLIPFPWHFTQHLQYGYTQVFAHIAYPWYAIGGMMVYFTGYMLAHFKKMLSDKNSRLLLQLTIFGVMFWLLPAFTNAGIGSRYTMCSYAALMPGAVYVFARLKNTKPFAIYAICYILVLTAVLITCHHFHNVA